MNFDDDFNDPQVRQQINFVFSKWARGNLPKSKWVDHDEMVEGNAFKPIFDRVVNQTQFESMHDRMDAVFKPFYGLNK